MNKGSLSRHWKSKGKRGFPAIVGEMDGLSRHTATAQRKGEKERERGGEFSFLSAQEKRRRRSGTVSEEEDDPAITRSVSWSIISSDNIS